MVKTSTYTRQELTRKTETTLHIYNRKKLIQSCGQQRMENLRAKKRYWGNSEISNHCKPFSALGWRNKRIRCPQGSWRPCVSFCRSKNFRRKTVILSICHSLFSIGFVWAIISMNSQVWNYIYIFIIQIK